MFDQNKLGANSRQKSYLSVKSIAPEDVMIFFNNSFIETNIP